MDSKVVWSLVSVAFGWLLGQGTTIVKDWWAAKKLLTGLLSELEDIQDQLQRVVMIHARQLQFFALKAMEPSASLPIQNLFFKQYFKDAFPNLTREQRISYQLIHTSLENLNRKNEEIASYFVEVNKDLKLVPDAKKALAAINLWGDQVIALYKSAMDVRWHIEYHLQHPTSPAFDLMGPMHESYVKFQKELDDEVKSIIEKAKALKREDLEEIYNPEAFFHGKNAG